MSERDSYKLGTPCWVDLTTNDVAVANRFYQELFGWEIEDQGEEYGHYGMATLRGKTVAGIGPIQPGEAMPSVWSTYLATPNLDTTMAKVKDAGGTVVMPPMDIGEAGRMAVAADAAGAFVGFWQAKDHVGSQLVNEPNTLCWNELHVRDADTADEFYAAVCGFEYESMSDTPDFDYNLLKVDGDAVGGRMKLGAGMPAEMPSYWLSYFAVEDTDATVEKIRSLDGSLVSGPDDSPYGRMAVCTDPTGATFAIIAMTDPS
jgi:predicted enzyme related to lactoylglutathione lyase